MPLAKPKLPNCCPTVRHGPPQQLDLWDTPNDGSLCLWRTFALYGVDKSGAYIQQWWIFILYDEHSWVITQFCEDACPISKWIPKFTNDIPKVERFGAWKKKNKSPSDHNGKARIYRALFTLILALGGPFWICWIEIQTIKIRSKKHVPQARLSWWCFGAGTRSFF